MCKICIFYGFGWTRPFISDCNRFELMWSIFCYIVSRDCVYVNCLLSNVDFVLNNTKYCQGNALYVRIINCMSKNM